MITASKLRKPLHLKQVVHKDRRGTLVELLIKKKIKFNFKKCITVFSKKNVIRGLHLQRKKSQGKFVTVIKGKIYDVALDLRKRSKTYGKHFSIILSEKNSKSIYIPPGFAHGFCSLEKENFIIYNCTNYRDKNSEIGIRYNDKKLNIKWPINKPILSNKDKKNMTFDEFKKKYKK